MLINHTVRARTLLYALACFVGGAALLWRPEAASAGISLGLSIASTVVLPTLFPFLVLGAFLSQSGLAVSIGKCFEGTVRRLFGLPGCCTAVLLIGFLGGYPAGGAVVGELIRTGQLSREDGERVLRFCVCGGPGFIISTVGVGMMGSVTFGVLLYAAQVIAALIIGIASRGKGRSFPDVSPPRLTVGASALVDAVTLSCQSALTMCGFLVLFSSCLSIWNTLPIADHTDISLLVTCFCEVTCGCLSAAQMGTFAPPLLGFAIGFGGLSVHCQLSAFLHGTGAMTRQFFKWRILHGLLAAALFLLLLRFFPVSLPVLLGSPSVVPFSTDVGMALCLLAVCGIWLLYVDKERPVHYNGIK